MSPLRVLLFLRQTHLQLTIFIPLMIMVHPLIHTQLTQHHNTHLENSFQFRSWPPL